MVEMVDVFTIVQELRGGKFCETKKGQVINIHIYIERERRDRRGRIKILISPRISKSNYQRWIILLKYRIGLSKALSQQ